MSYNKEKSAIKSYSNETSCVPSVCPETSHELQVHQLALVGADLGRKATLADVGQTGGEANTAAGKVCLSHSA